MLLVSLFVSLLGCKQVARELAEVGAKAGARGAAVELAEGGAKLAARESGHGAEIAKVAADIAAQVAQQGGFATEDVDLSGEWSLASQPFDEWTTRASGPRTRIGPGTYRAETSLVMSKPVDSNNVVIQASFVAIEVWGADVECYKVESVRSVNVLAEGLDSAAVAALERQLRSSLEKEMREVTCDAVVQRTADLLVTRDADGDVTTERRVSR